MLTATSRHKSSGTWRHSIASSGSTAADSLAPAEVPVEPAGDAAVRLDGVGVADVAGEQPAAIIAVISATTGTDQRHVGRVRAIGPDLNAPIQV